MAVQYAFSQITTTGLKLAVDAADPLSYPGSGTTWTDVTGNGFTGTISSSISFAATNRGALVSSNSSSAVSFSGSAADFGQGSFTVEMAFLPSVINGRHWLYSKNSGSFPNFGAFITGSGGSGRLTAFYNISSTVSSSATTAVGSIVTGSNYVLDVTYIPTSLFTSVYLNSNLSSSGSANGIGSLSTSASLLLLNNTTASNAGTVGNLYNFKVYNPYINFSNIRKNYNSMCSRFGLPLALYTPPAPLLLDTYTGAAAAYSLRKLRNDYTGDAIRVRRSSDNTESDIGFDGNGDLNTAALLSFVGVGNGFVTTWYDQSGNGLNATQSTAANQPQIVSSGSVITQNGKPSIDSQSKVLTIPSSTSTFNFIHNGTQSTICYIGSSTNRAVLGNYGGSSGNVGFGFENSTGNVYFVMTKGASSQFPIIANSSVSFSTQKLVFISIDADNTSATDRLIFNINGGSNIKPNIQTTSPSSANATHNLQIGANGNNVDLGDCKHQELIIYSSDQSSNRTGIESNINSYYSIY